MLLMSFKFYKKVFDMRAPGQEPRSIPLDRIWNLTSLNWTIEDKLFICFSGVAGIRYVADASDDWKSERVLLTINLRSVLPLRDGFSPLFDPERVVSKFSIDTFWFQGDGDNGGFSLNSAAHRPPVGNRFSSDMRFIVDIGTKSEDRAHIDKLGFHVTATGNLFQLEESGSEFEG